MKINSLITMVILFISVNCIAQESENVELLAELYHTGDYKDFAIEEERLYVASGYGLEVFDISNPDSVVFLGRAPSQDSAESIAVKDGYVFLADWTRGVNLYDCRDPENITKDENFRYETASLFEELYIHENRLYISVANIGTRVYNISNPAEPENLSTYMRPRWPFGMVTQDSLTYIIDYYEDEIIVADLRNFRRYETLNEVQTNLQWPREISVMNSLLIVSYSGGGLSIYSLENPVEPELIIDYRDIDSHIWDVKLIGDYAYVGTSVSGLITLDLSNPAEPEIVAVDSTHSYTLHIESLAENLFVSGTLGLSILNAENPVELEQRDMYLKTHIVHSFSVGSDYLYLPRWEFGMHILNVSDPSQPEIINEIDSIGVVRVVATEDNWLYLNALDYETDETYLCAWNMEDPANPEETLRAELELPFGSYKIFNNFLTITNIDAGIIIYDISNRRNPEYITTISEYHYTEIFIDGEMLYCIDIDHNFYVYNISEIESPEYLDQHDDWDYAYSVVAEGDRVYVSCGGDGVRILNVSDPNFVSTERTISANDWITQCEIEDS
ncbi:hypothetical protein H8D57_00460, partial [bacterium]|nr:hypothetical protein [bacterium]